MKKLLHFGRKALFYVRVLSGYEDRRIRSYSLQLEKRIQEAEEKKAAIRKLPEQVILSEVRRRVEEMQNLNKKLEETSNPIKDSSESVANKALVELAVPQGKNFVMSTLSYKAILAVVALGSTGKTQQQLLHFLGLNDLENLRSLAKMIINITRTPVLGTASGFRSQAEALEISFFNAVWLHEDYSFTPSFEANVKYLFNAESHALKKGEEGCVIAKPINSWAARVTKGLVKEILPQELSGQTRLVLTNAIYFKGKWVDKFEKSCSQYRNFYLLNEQIIQAPFMTSMKQKRLYGEFSSFKVLGLPYQCNQDQRRFQIYIFLPDKKDGLLSLIQMLNSYPEFLNGNLDLREVNLAELWIPKFKFSYEFDGSKILQDLGLTLPFKADNKDFKGLVISHTRETMHVSNVLHKATIEVDEEGTEAAAVSLVLCGCAPGYRSARSFIADHPFYFLIREETTKTVFFSGAVLNPLADS